MADEHHIAKLREGVLEWNAWRSTSSATVPDLSGADLAGLQLIPQGEHGPIDVRHFEHGWGFTDPGTPVNLRNVNLRGVNLRNAGLQSADFTAADLAGADLSGADARAALFVGARMDEAVLDEAQLESAELTGASLERASFVRAFLYKADLSNVKAHSAIFKEAILSVAKFDDAVLAVASFFGARLVETSFDGAYAIAADLRRAVAKEASFRHADLDRACLDGAVLDEAMLEGTTLRRAQLRKASLVGAALDGSNLQEADLSGADLRNASLRNAHLSHAHLEKADLREASLARADLRNACADGANLGGASLRGSLFTNASLKGADLSQCKVYGISAWDVNLDGASQRDLVFTPKGEPAATVDDLEMAQLIYVLSQNEKIRRVLDNLSRKVVLILGRFSPPRMAVLEEIRGGLRKLGYVPLLFTFEPSASRNLTETIATLTALVRFVIADITDPKSVPQELQAIVSQFVSVPVQPIILAKQRPYALFESIEEHQSVLPLYRYAGIPALRKTFESNVVRPAESLAAGIAESRTRKREKIRRAAAK